VFGVHGRLITRVFVVFDIISFLVQCAGSGVASSVEWVGNTAQVGVYILIGGLCLQAVAFGFFLGILGRFHYLAKRKGVVAGDAPVGWERVVVAVYVSSVLIMVCLFCFLSLRVRDGDADDCRYAASTAWPSSARELRDMPSGMSGCSGSSSRCR
jgi:hypothetical protein